MNLIKFSERTPLGYVVYEVGSNPNTLSLYVRATVDINGKSIGATVVTSRHEHDSGNIKQRLTEMIGRTISRELERPFD